MEESKVILESETVSLLKPKREQSEKQKAAWAKAQQTRLDNAAVKREAFAILKEAKDAKRELTIAKTLAKQEKNIKKIIEESESESEEEQEVIIVKKKKKKPKPQPKIIYQEASSSEEEEEPPPPPHTKPRPTKKVIKEQPQIQLPIKPIVRFF